MDESTSSEAGLYWILIHAPTAVLMRHAEEMGWKMPVRVSGTEAPFLPFPANVTPVSRACADRGRRQRSASMRSRHLQDAARHPSANSRLLRGAVSTRPPQEVRSSRDFIRRINKYLISFLNYDKPNKLFSNAQRGRLVRGENVVALQKKTVFFTF